jgi:hypothetical protein
MDVFNTCVYGAQYGIIMYAKCVKASETDAADGAAEGLYVSGEIAGAVCDGKDAKYSCSGNSVVRSACDGDCENIPGTYDDSAKTNEEYYGSAQCTVASASAEIGAACNVKEFESYCQSSSVAVSCPGGSIYARQCPDGSVCKAGLCVPSNTCWGVGCSGYGGGSNPSNPSGGATCDVYDCTSVAELAADCQGDGYEYAICSADGYTCATRKSSLDSSCSGDELGYTVWTEQGDVEACLVIGADESCLGGGGNPSQGGGVITCEAFESQYGPCQLKSGDSCADHCGVEACCVDLDTGSIDCGCQGGGGSQDAYSVCDGDCSTMPGSTAICDPEGYYQCSKPCTTEGSKTTLCDDLNGKGKWGSYPAVCTAVGSEYYYLKTGDATQCNGTCNADNTACDEGGEVPPVNGDDTFFDCSDMTSGGKTLGALCAADDSTTTKALCVACNERSYFCATPAQAQQAIGQSAFDVMHKDLCESGSGDVCDVFDCSDLTNNGKTAKQICAEKGNDSALCGIDSDDPTSLALYCADRSTANDSECADGETAYSSGGQIICLIVGEDQACLSGGSGDYEVCNGDCSTMPGSTAICDPEGYYQCSKPCTTEGSETTLCDDMTGEGKWGSYKAVCTAVGSEYYYLMASNATYCKGTCNADNTACK